MNEPQHNKTNKITRAPSEDAHTYQILRCPHEKALDPWLPLKRTAKALIRLGECPGRSESWLGAEVILLLLPCFGSNIEITPRRAVSMSELNCQGRLGRTFV